MHNVVTQPYNRPANIDEDNYLVTLAEEYDLAGRVVETGAEVDLTEFLKAHPTGKARIWAVGISRPAERAWLRKEVGDLVLIYGSGEVYAYGTISAKVEWLHNDKIWPSGENWDHIYSLTDYHELPDGQRLAYQGLRELTDKLDVYSVGCRPLSEFGVDRDALIDFVVRTGPRRGVAISVERPGIPDGVTADNVRSAIDWLKSNQVPEGFGERTEWVLVAESRWFPPKAVVGVAVREATGALLEARDFSGGEGSGQANNFLRQLGFEVLRRQSDGVRLDPITAWLDLIKTSTRAIVNGQEAPHQPATALWFIAEFERGHPQLQAWGDIRTKIGSAVVAAGAENIPSSPIAVLLNQGVLKATGLDLPITTSSSVARSILNSANPLIGLPNDVYNEFGAQPDRIPEAISEIGKLFVSSEQRDGVLRSLDLRDSNRSTSPAPVGVDAPGRHARTALSIKRSEEVAKWVKKHYDDTCQLCGVRLVVPSGAVSDAAHIRALGSPHDGPDVVENILCLCPNDHRLFDRGAWIVERDLSVVDVVKGETSGVLSFRTGHSVDFGHLQYHRNLWSAQL